MVALALTSCTNDSFDPIYEPEEGRLPIQLYGEIKQVNISRVNDEGFCDGDAVGIYVVNFENGESGILKTDGNQADNVKYTFDESAFTWNPESDVYFSDNHTHVDIIGYYPYANPASVSEYQFEVQKDQSTAAANGLLGGYEASDFLWGKAADITPTATRIKLKFQHKMAGVHVTLIEGNNWTDGEWEQVEKSVLVTNTKRESTINFATGEVSAVGDVATTGIVPYASGDNFRAVVVPQIVAGGTALLSLTVDGIPYGYKYKVDNAYADFEYISGKLHKFSVKVSKKQQGDLEFEVVGVSITAWEADNASHDASAREYIIVDVPEPNTKESALSAAISDAGYDYTEIKNLKVTGCINNLDFDFMRDRMTKLQSINLKDVTISENGESYPTNAIPNRAFYNKITLVRFVFPDNITKIGESAFNGTNLSGSLIIPNGVTHIKNYAFSGCKALNGTLELSRALRYIGEGAFRLCGFNGSLDIPDSVVSIGVQSFSGCEGFTGSLQLPSGLEELGAQAFYHCKNFRGSLTIPSKNIHIPNLSFSQCGFDGQLELPSNIISIGDGAFSGCKFRGLLKLPSGIVTIGEGAFMGNNFSGTLELPKELTAIGREAFYNCQRLTGIVEIPQDVIAIPASTFKGCNQLQGIILPRTMENIGSSAFENCYQLNSIVCKATTPPSIAANAFNGVAKDNFTVEVPETAVMEYSTAPGWKEFKQFSAYRDFSISRNLIRTLNAAYSKELVLRAEAGAAWTVEAPEWITVTPSSGVGKQIVTISVNEMTAGDVGTFKVQSYNASGSITETSYSGRSGKVVFHLTGKGYSSTTTVEQYDYQYGDGDVITNQTKEVGNGVNIVFMGDCFDARDIATGKYLNGVNEAINHFFAVEPYKSYQKYFNIYTIIGLSADSGVGSVNTIREAKFGSQYGLQAAGKVGVNQDVCFEYACKAPTVTESNLNQTPIVLIENTYDYDGITYMWGDGSAIALCPMSIDEYPYDYRGIVQHEAGGHAFGKLGDEYIYHNSFIQTCNCGCCDHVEEFNRWKSYGFYDNLSLSGDMNKVPWNHMIFDSQFSGMVDVYEGGFFHTRGVFRSESNSCMNNNVPYFSAISRESIVKRIMQYAGMSYTYEEFKAKDIPLATEDATTMTFANSRSRFSIYTTKNQSAPVFMGDKPVLSKSNK